MYEEYEAVLGVDPIIWLPGPPGQLWVKIGIPGDKPNFPDNLALVRAKLSVVGSSAKIKPFAPGFSVTPEESTCVKVDPTGSTVAFELKPTKAGTFTVGAFVHLYESEDCSGTAIPKGTTSLQTKVIVDRGWEFWEKFWEKLLEFWGAFLVLFFAVLLFLMRKKLKQWIGFGDDNDG